MALATASGYPQHSGILVPKIWSSKTLVKFYEATVLAAIANTEYEGEIKDVGDTVEIRTTPTINIKKYVKGADLTYENPQPDTVTLNIDKANYFGFLVEDVDKHQADYNFQDDWARDASEQMKIVIEGGKTSEGITGVLPDIYADAAAANKGATAGKLSSGYNLGVTGAPLAMNKTNILDVIINCGTVLDEQNVPEEGRWIVLPAWACGMIKKSDLKDASLSGDTTSIMRNGRIGMIDRFEVFNSNLLGLTVDGATTVTNSIFGHKSALTFASQITRMEDLGRSQSTFGNLYRGLNVYGYEVIKPEALGHLYAYRAA